jgi:hypothetical protein
MSYKQVTQHPQGVTERKALEGLLYKNATRYRYKFGLVAEFNLLFSPSGGTPLDSFVRGMGEDPNEQFLYLSELAERGFSKRGIIPTICEAHRINCMVVHLTDDGKLGVNEYYSTGPFQDSTDASWLFFVLITDGVGFEPVFLIGETEDFFILRQDDPFIAALHISWYTKLLVSREDGMTEVATKIPPLLELFRRTKGEGMFDDLLAFEEDNEISWRDTTSTLEANDDIQWQGTTSPPSTLGVKNEIYQRGTTSPPSTLEGEKIIWPSRTTTHSSLAL